MSEHSRNSGERRLLACSVRQPAGHLNAFKMQAVTGLFTKAFRQAAEKDRPAACASRKREQRNR
jgi:hypothetical protein